MEPTHCGLCGRRLGQHHEDCVMGENERLRHVLSPLTGVLDALNEGMTPQPSMSLRRSLVEQAREVLRGR